MHVNRSGRAVDVIPGDAHIVLSVQTDGKLLLRSYREGEFNAMYAYGDDSVLAEIAPLLAELRAELIAPHQPTTESAAAGA